METDSGDPPVLIHASEYTSSYDSSVHTLVLLSCYNKQAQYVNTECELVACWPCHTTRKGSGLHSVQTVISAQRPEHTKATRVYTAHTQIWNYTMYSKNLVEYGTSDSAEEAPSKAAAIRTDASGTRVPPLSHAIANSASMEPMLSIASASLSDLSEAKVNEKESVVETMEIAMGDQEDCNPADSKHPNTEEAVTLKTNRPIEAKNSRKSLNLNE